MEKKRKTIEELEEAWSRGGKLGGPRRAEVLIKRKLSQIGRKAALARWANHEKKAK